jgi:hypothetical protein
MVPAAAAETAWVWLMRTLLHDSIQISPKRMI